MNLSNIIFFFFSSFPTWTMCMFKEHKENWQIEEVFSSVPLFVLRRCWAFVCPPRDLQWGGRNKKAEGPRTQCTSPPWYLTEVPGWVEFSCYCSFLLPVLVIFFHIIRKYLSDAKLSVVTSLTLRHTKATTRFSSWGQTRVLKALQTIHSYK